LDERGHVYFNDVASWRRIPEYERFIRQSPAAEIAARLMGSSKANIFYDSVFVRSFGTTARTPWHQDVPYWCVEGDHVIGLWLPLDPVARENALEFVRGSHRWGRQFRRLSFFEPGREEHTFSVARDAAAAEPMPDIDAERAKHDIVAWAMEPGDCIAFHGMVIHGGSGNLAPDRRLRVFVTRWTGDDARYALKPGGVDPDLKGHGLKPGDAMDCAMFPRIWPRAADAEREGV